MIVELVSFSEMIIFRLRLRVCHISPIVLESIILRLHVNETAGGGEGEKRRVNTRAQMA